MIHRIPPNKLGAEVLTHPEPGAGGKRYCAGIQPCLSPGRSREPDPQSCLVQQDQGRTPVWPTAAHHQFAISDNRKVRLWPSSDVQRVLLGVLCRNFCSLFLQVSPEVVTDHTAMLWTQQVDPSLSWGPMTYLGCQSCTGAPTWHTWDTRAAQHLESLPRQQTKRLLTIQGGRR